MAFLQSDFPPSTAPVRGAQGGQSGPRARRPMPFAKVARPRVISPGGIAVGVASLVGVGLPGYAAFAATESIALGILTADIAFLLAVAVWSSVSGR